MNAASLFLVIAIAMNFAPLAVADEIPCNTCDAAPCANQNTPPSWIFRRSTYTHDPHTGARVAQYMRLPAIEPLEDERLVTSRYHRTRTNLRGIGGSVENYYEVQSWGNGRGGLDAEWERFHDAWKESILQGGYYNQYPGYGNGYGNGFGYSGPYGFNGYYGSGYGNPGYGYPGIGNGGPYWGPQQSWHGNGGHNNHGDDGHDHHGDGGHDDDHSHGGGH
jgi:hypothetical protein